MQDRFHSRFLFLILRRENTSFGNARHISMLARSFNLTFIFDDIHKVSVSEVFGGSRSEAAFFCQSRFFLQWHSSDRWLP